MVALNVDYTINHMTIEFSKAKSNALNNVQTYFKDMIRDYNKSLSKEMSSENFNIEAMDEIIDTLRHVSNKLITLLSNINESDTLLDLIGVLNEEFHGDDALVFFMVFDVPTCVED